MEPAELIRTSRLAHGLSQAALARRAGTTQSAISRLESGREVPTVSRLEQLLVSLGDELVLRARPLDPGRAWSDVADDRARTMSERLEQGFALATFASELAVSARR